MIRIFNRIAWPKRALLAAAGLIAVPLMVVAFGRPEPRRTADPQIESLRVALKQCLSQLSAQQQLIEGLTAAQQLEATSVTELKNHVELLTGHMEGFAKRVEGSEGVLQTANRLNDVHGRLTKVETLLTRLDADLHTPQILNQTLERQKGLVRPQPNH
jgi:chromosome segregation ATPase